MALPHSCEERAPLSQGVEVVNLSVPPLPAHCGWMSSSHVRGPTGPAQACGQCARISEPGLPVRKGLPHACAGPVGCRLPHTQPIFPCLDRPGSGRGASGKVGQEHVTDG